MFLTQIINVKRYNVVWNIKQQYWNNYLQGETKMLWTKHGNSRTNINTVIAYTFFSSNI